MTNSKDDVARRRRVLIWLLMSLFLRGWSSPVSARLIPLTDPFQLNTETVGDQTVPRIFSMEDGGFVAVWYHGFLVGYHLSFDGPLDVEAVRGRVFESDGTPRGNEFEFKGQRPPLLAASRGDSLVIWDNAGGAETALGLFAVDGTRLDLWSIADEVPDVRSQLSIARSHERSIVVAWDESPFGNVVAQLFDENGQPRPQAKIVVALEESPFNQGVINPLVRAAADGSFAVAWWAEISGMLWTRHFDGQGAPIHGGIFSEAVDRGSFDLCMDRASGSSVIAWGEKALHFSGVPGANDPICTGIGDSSVACAGEDRFIVAENRYAYATTDGPVFGSERLLALRAFSARGRAIRVLGTAIIPAPVPRVAPLMAIPFIASIGPETIAVAWHDCSAPCRDLSGCSIGCEAYAQLFRLTETPDCAGDCNGDGRVTIDELVTAVDLALNGNAEAQADPTRCPALESGGDCRITLAELVRGVRSSLDGCAG